ncbi:MAG TPA: hypothetical protein VFU63_08015 [Ktedonobacterales bacterium]|nr:hypothetical protein [Ktedonobacterales bacterium]
MTTPTPDPAIAPSGANTPAPDALAIPRARVLVALILSLLITLAATLLAVLALVWNAQPWLAIPAIPIALFFATLSLVATRALLAR